VAQLVGAGMRVTIEQSPHRILAVQGYVDAGAEVAPEGSWVSAPKEALILGLKELPEDGTPLRHRHIMFGHAFKGQGAGRILLQRFAAGGGALYDLEYLVDADGRRVTAFGYWAGFAGAAVSALAWAAQARGQTCPPVTTWASSPALLADVQEALNAAGATRPDALVIGALGRVGRGTGALCEAMGIPVTAWDMAETAHGGPFPEVLHHGLFFNCILAAPGVPVFVPRDAGGMERRLRVIGDIACDPDSDYNPVPVYNAATSWERPVVRVHDAPPLDVMAIDNLPSLLPLESSEDFADQLLPHLMTLDRLDEGVWGRAHQTFMQHRPEG
jgi:saccharopine dehydrogenase (NAD+, L-lysine-forming)